MQSKKNIWEGRMQRLTRKSLEYKDTWIADGSLSNIEGVVRGNAIDRLAELEDILESWHIENLEELKIRLNDCQVYHLQNNSNETLIHNLKNELAELKQAQKQLAIEELEKVKKYNRTLSLRGRPYIDIFINNQIKELKGEK